MNDPSGSWWRRWDLHFHTPRSYDYKNKSATAAGIVSALIKANVSVVAITDHHVLDAGFIKEMQTAGTGKLTVFPGIELSSNLGGDEGVHFIAIFAEDVDLAYTSSELMAKLELAQKRKRGTAEERLYVEFPAAVKVVQELGGIISIHGHGKAANYETISSNLKFKQQQKTDLLRECVDIIEVGGADKIAPYREKIFPAIKFSLPIIVGSDNHNVALYSVPACCWIKADPTFAGLKMALREPQERFFIGDSPPAIDRLANDKTHYIKTISFKKTVEMPAGEEWLQGEVPLNPGLVAIIGNKGSGKSALADSLGLLGTCSTSDAFSFLDVKRFRDPKTGRSQYVQATLQWHDGSPQTRLLNEAVGADEPERVKFLPQNFVEKVCNELTTPGGGEFERELKKVIFSKLQTAERLGKRTLDELVQFRTQEIRKAADALATELIELSVERAASEARLDPTVRSGLKKQIAQRNEEIKSHEAMKPAPVSAPPDDPATSPEKKAELERLAGLKNERDALAEKIKAAEATVSAEQLRSATAKKLLDKLENVRSEVNRHVVDLTPEATSLGLTADKLVTLTVDSASVQKVRDDALRKRDVARTLLEGPKPEGLRTKKKTKDEQINVAQVSLDRPNQEYQVYVESLAAWESAKNILIGSEDDPESLNGMEADLAALDKVPQQIDEIQMKQENIAAEIHKLRVSEVGVYTDLYEPVQKFISDHPLAKNHLTLEFKVELVQESVVDGLLQHLNQQRAGTFCGAEEGRAAAESLAAIVDWSKWDEVKAFATNICKRLHKDMRPGCGGAVQLKTQIKKGKTAADLYTWLYGLGYVRPRYLLRWDGKEVSQLSPGERGTLLLIFYLLIDDSDLPLIIDQPEANLDNLTVAQKLVQCIRDARARRQVVIVTHNPNLAVVCDADQIIHASIERANGNRITYKTGALEHPEMNRFAIDVLEGSRGPFDKRDETYSVMGE